MAPARAPRRSLLARALGHAVLLSAAITAGACQEIAGVSDYRVGGPCESANDCPATGDPCQLAMCLYGYCTTMLGRAYSVDERCVGTCIEGQVQFPEPAHPFRPDCGECVIVVESPCAPLCDGGKHDGAETGIDCGGPDCAPCPPFQVCRADSDCASGVCAPSEIYCGDLDCCAASPEGHPETYP
jgi:hypothetical protein